MFVTHTKQLPSLETSQQRGLQTQSSSLLASNSNVVTPLDNFIKANKSHYAADPIHADPVTSSLSPSRATNSASYTIVQTKKFRRDRYAAADGDYQYSMEDSAASVARNQASAESSLQRLQAGQSQ